jgi:DNA-binding NarL/FixJ family response regulator
MFPEVRVFIADDCPRVRSALRVLIENAVSNCKVTGEAEDLSGLQADVNRKSADVVLLDWELPGIPGNIVNTADLISQMHKTGQLVVAFSGYSEARSQACLAGADAFISKIDPPESLIQMLRTVGAKQRRGE